MFEFPDPLTLFALARVIQAVTIVIAVGVGLWSHDASRRRAAGRLISILRRRPGDPDARNDRPATRDGSRRVRPPRQTTTIVRRVRRRRTIDAPVLRHPAAAGPARRHRRRGRRPPRRG